MLETDKNACVAKVLQQRFACLFVSSTQILPQSASLTAPSRGGLLFEVWRSLLVEGVVFYGVEF